MLVKPAMSISLLGLVLWAGCIRAACTWVLRGTEMEIPHVKRKKREKLRPWHSGDGE